MQKGSRNPELYDDDGVLKSIKRAKKKYEKETVWNVRVRVPIEWRDQIEAYVNAKIPNPEYPDDRDKDIPRYGSINKMICDLIRKEIIQSESTKAKEE